MNDVTNGNLAQVRDALAGITGVKIAPATIAVADRYLVAVRMSRELDAVDSFRRNNFAAYWPSFEELRPTKRWLNGHPVCRRKRIGIIPGYVFPEVAPGSLMLDRIVGAIDFVRGFNGYPLLIPDADIQIIRGIEIGMNTPDPVKLKAAHTSKVGEKVRFIDDLFGRWPP